ncbi:MAG: hypothetical protein FWC27_00230, partial [Firmicutes bacterium]|nr:hypothetical protein [Bacillota bacterium]
MAGDDRKPDRDEAGDIMRPVEERKETPAPAEEPIRLSDTELEWRARVAQEGRQQQKTERKARFATRMGRYSRREKRAERPRERRRAPRSGRWRLAAEIVPFAALLLLAPFV